MPYLIQSSNFKVVRVISRNKSVSLKVTIYRESTVIVTGCQNSPFELPQNFISLNDSSTLVDSLE